MGTSSKRTVVQPVPETMESKKRGFALDWIGKISKCFRIKSQNRTPEVQKKPTKPTTITPVAVVEELFGTLKIDEKNVKEASNDEEVKKQVENEEDSGNDDFETKVIDDDRKCGKLNSQSSRDSGYSDKNNDACEEITASMDKLELESDKKKKKKIVRRLISRGPTPRKAGKVRSGQPYPEHRPPSPVLNNQAEINQLNLQTLTGGRVTFKCDVIDYEAVLLPQNIEDNSYGQLDIIDEVIAEDRLHIQDTDIHCHNEVHDNHNEPSTTICFDYKFDDLPFENSINTTDNESTANETGTSNVLMEDILCGNFYPDNSFCSNDSLENELPSASPLHGVTLENYADTQIGKESIETDNFNPQLIDQLLLENEPLSKTVDLLAAEITGPFPADYMNDTIERTQMTDDFGQSSIDNQSSSYGECSMFPTPPRSVNVHSPCSQFSGTSPSHIAFSPTCLSPNAIHNLETYQECGRDAADTKLETLKQFKERQKEIVTQLEKNACCQRNKTKTLEQFKKHMDKLKPVISFNLCREIAKLDVEKEGFQTLYGAISELSVGTDKEDIALSTFVLLCQRILSVESAAFLDRRGYKLLEDAVTKGHNYPVLTQFAVECIRNAINENPELVAGKNYLFDEVIEGGDNLVCLCARMGDQYADLLYWLVRRGAAELPLFDPCHTNTEGHSALHVACRPRSGRPARLRTVHVLLAHGGADINQGDKNGNDTALHHAVNDSACDLSVVLLLFSFLPQKDWHVYANKKNGSSMTPADYAKRYARKQGDSGAGTDKVLLFLKKKCRKIPLKSDSDN